MPSLILAIDQGTTGTTAILVDVIGKIVGKAYREIDQIYPQPGWVEHGPDNIWESVTQVIAEVMDISHVPFKEIAAIGITNQRETCLFWERKSGRPLGNAIVWQCRRSSTICEHLKQEGMSDFFLGRTGLMIDAYFSASKIKWFLENETDAKKKAGAGDLLFGTVDSWLLWKLTGQKIHRTDATNASRTMLYNIYKREWDFEILKILGIPEEILPEVCDSAFSYGETSPELTGGVAIPIAGVAGDQQAALFGQCCFSPGESKNTYGTGAFMLMYTGDKPPGERHNRLLTTLCADFSGKPAFAIEGSVFNCGTAVQFLRDSLGIISSAAETEELAQSIRSNQGVYFVPAFTGLGAPYWDMYARGAIVGLTRGVGKKELARAALESMAYQTKDLFDCMCDFAKETPSRLKVDGGAAANNFLMQFQADILHVDIDRPCNIESTAMGAAYLAGLSIGFWKEASDLKKLQETQKRFSPQMRVEESAELYRGWKNAIKQVRCI